MTHWISWHRSFFFFCGQGLYAERGFSSAAFSRARTPAARHSVLPFLQEKSSRNYLTRKKISMSYLRCEVTCGGKLRTGLIGGSMESTAGLKKRSAMSDPVNLPSMIPPRRSPRPSSTCINKILSQSVEILILEIGDGGYFGVFNDCFRTLKNDYSMLLSAVPKIRIL